MPEAQLEDSGSGLAPAGEGWFVVNVRDAECLTSETDEEGLRSSGSECTFEAGAPCTGLPLLRSGRQRFYYALFFAAFLPCTRNLTH